MCLRANVWVGVGWAGRAPPPRVTGRAHRQLSDFDWGAHSDFNKFAKKTFSWAADGALLFLI